ncbi:chromatin-remodeling ATPase INO80 isoform X1 [Ixodes scapularis]
MGGVGAVASYVKRSRNQVSALEGRPGPGEVTESWGPSLSAGASSSCRLLVTTFHDEHGSRCLDCGQARPYEDQQRARSAERKSEEKPTSFRVVRARKPGDERELERVDERRPSTPAPKFINLEISALLDRSLASDYSLESISTRGGSAVSRAPEPSNLSYVKRSRNQVSALEGRPGPGEVTESWGPSLSAGASSSCRLLVTTFHDEHGSRCLDCGQARPYEDQQRARSAERKSEEKPTSFRVVRARKPGDERELERVDERRPSTPAPKFINLEISALLDRSLASDYSLESISTRGGSAVSRAPESSNLRTDVVLVGTVPQLLYFLNLESALVSVQTQAVVLDALQHPRQPIVVFSSRLSSDENVIRNSLHFFKAVQELFHIKIWGSAGHCILQSWNRRQSRWPSIFHPSHVHHSLFKSLDGRPTGGFSFSRFVGLSSSELAKVMLCGLLERFLAILAELKEAQRTHHTHVWRENQDSGRHLSHRSLLVTSHAPTGAASLSESATLRGLVFGAEPRCYALETQRLHATRETAAHRELRQRKVKTRHHHHHHHHHHGGSGGGTSAAPGAPAGAVTSHHGATAPTTPSAKKAHHHQPQPPQQQQQQPPPQHQHGPASPPALPEFPHRPLPVQVLECVPTEVPRFLVSCTSPRVTAEPPELWCHSSSALWWWRGVQACGSPQAHRWWRTGQLPGAPATQGAVFGPPPTPEGGLASARPLRGWSHICIPDKETLVTDSGKLQVLDSLLCRLKSEGHRVLIYSQMTRMIDLLEEYMWHRKHTYMRLDGSSKISDRRDMVADFQTRSDIFVFLLSTRAGGLGINLTAADTVVFYDSDWNPTVDQQAMDRAHRLGQTKQVTVYRLVCKGTIEERILQRAREKSEIQRMVISGGNFKPDTLKPKEVVSLLLDDAELERKFRQRQEERKQLEDGPEKQPKERKRRSDKGEKRGPRKKRAPVEHNTTIPSVSSAPPPSLALHQDTESVVSLDSVPPSPYSEQSLSSVAVAQDESSSEGPLIVDDGSPSATPVPTPATPDGGGTVSPGGSGKGRSGRGTGRARGRPRGSTRRAPAALRGSMLAAAERAGAQAGAQAGFAAYGYSVPWNGPPSGTAGSGPGSDDTSALHAPAPMVACSNIVRRSIEDHVTARTTW